MLFLHCHVYLTEQKILYDRGDVGNPRITGVDTPLLGERFQSIAAAAILERQAFLHTRRHRDAENDTLYAPRQGDAYRRRARAA